VRECLRADRLTAEKKMRVREVFHNRRLYLSYWFLATRAFMVSHRRLIAMLVALAAVACAIALLCLLGIFSPGLPTGWVVQQSGMQSDNNQCPTMTIKVSDWQYMDFELKCNATGKNFK